ncbi:hypothetical protein ACWH4V_09530 [Bacillus mojavensis]
MSSANKNLHFQSSENSSKKEITDTSSKLEQSGLNLLAPSHIFWKKILEEKRVKWGTKERTAYRNWYDKKYGKKTWANFENHHQLSREYGSGNMTGNLIPLDKSFRRTEVNPWWAYY